MHAPTRDAGLDDLIRRLNRGDDGAAEQVFAVYEPYLQTVVRRHFSRRLRAKFDSSDVLQSVWVAVLAHFRRSGDRFVDAEHLRAFLTRAVRNRVIDFYRRNERAVRRERSLEESVPSELPPSPDPRPSQVARAKELWEQMLEACPPDHREVLRLRRQGFSASEIAAKTGYNYGSVYRILAEVTARLAREYPEIVPA